MGAVERRVYWAHMEVGAIEVAAAVVQALGAGQTVEKQYMDTLAGGLASAPWVPEANPGASSTSALRSSRALETWDLPVVGCLREPATTVVQAPVSLADAGVATVDTPNLLVDLASYGDPQDAGHPCIPRLAAGCWEPGKKSRMVARNSARAHSPLRAFHIAKHCTRPDHVDSRWS